MKCLIIAIVVVLPIECWAADKNGEYRETYPADHVTCESFLLAENECKHGRCLDLKTFSDWLMGYITSYNSNTPDTFDIAAKTDLKNSIIWLGNYCKQHPSNKYSQAAQSLMNELYPIRQKIKPKDWVEK